MGDKNAERQIPSKRIIPGASSKGGWVENLKTAYKVTGAVGIAAAAITHPTETKNTAWYIAHHLPVKGVERQANENLEARYAELVDVPDQQNDADVDLLYPNLGDQEKVDLNVQLQGERAIVSEHYLTDEAMDSLKELEPLIRQVSKEGYLPEDLLLGMVIVESVGNRYAYNEESGAKGLTQMTDEMAETYGLSISSVDLKDPNYDPTTDVDDRYVPEIILSATVKELQAAYQRTGDRGYAAWEWHAGARNVYAAIAIYVKSQYGEDLPNIIGVEDPVLSMQIAQEYRDKVAQYHINLFRLFKNAQVQQAFSGPEWDNTLIYVVRALAAIEEYRAKVDQNPL